MQSEDQYMERTSDLISKIRKMREAAEKEMNKFTRVADYDVRRVFGQKPKVATDASENAVPAKTGSSLRKVPAPPQSRQSAIEFPSSSLADDDDQEDA